MTLEDESQATGVRPGNLIAARYRVERVLSTGTTSVVVAARDLRSDDPVAAKLWPGAPYSEDEPAAQRFLINSRAVTRLQGEHVARVFDWGIADGTPYRIMEPLDGKDLGALIKERGAFPVQQAAAAILQACEALVEAQDLLGFLHLELEPANLFCVRRADGHQMLKVLDFGRPGRNLWRPERFEAPDRPGDSAMDGPSTDARPSLRGPPFYLSPEEFGAPHLVDARADIWALGVILFELLTGKLPFGGKTVPEVCFAIVTRPPPALRGFRPDAPKAMETIVLRCLEKDRQQRYENVGELARSLHPWAG